MIYRKMAYSAVLLALGVGLGYALAWIPNIELVSFVCVLAGFMLGAEWGIIDGALIFLLYSFLSPFGMAPLPLWIAQGIGGAFLGFLGYLWGTRLKKPLFAMALGISGTLVYDLLTNLAGFFFFPTENTFIVYLLSGLSFSLVHIIANGVIFAILFPIIARNYLKRHKIPMR